jgi:hypothetical protein
LPITLALLAVVLTSPSLQVGLVLDDYTHRLKLLGSKHFPEFFPPDGDMFTFWGHDSEHTVRLMDAGLLPWWTYEGTKAAFWRPLAVLTHRLDYQLWPNTPMLMHLQSLIWFGAVIAAVTVLYRRLMGPTWVAGLAALLYAVDDAHGLPVAFLANRNALLSTFFGVLSILAHDAWRRTGWRLGVIWGAILFGLSLLSKEEGMAVTAYLFAYAVFLDRGPWRLRLAALLPYAGVVIVWRLAYSAQGYGIWGLGPYVDPVGEPLRFAAALVEHVPLFLLGQWALPPPEVTIMVGPDTVRWLWIAAVACTVLIAIVFTPLLRRDRLARFYALGMLLSLLPICATFPANRLLWFVGIGAMGLLAQFFGVAFRRGERPLLYPLPRLFQVSLAGVLAFIHMVIAPAFLVYTAAVPMGTKALQDQILIRNPFDAAVERQDVIIVNAPSAVCAVFLPVLREVEGGYIPRRTRPLATGADGVTIHRRDERTVILRPGRGYLAWFFDQLGRGPQFPMSVGEWVELTGMTAEVLSLTDDKRPADVAFHFTVPLEDPSLRWLQWKDGAFVAFTPPPVGQTVHLPPAVPKLWHR